MTKFFAFCSVIAMAIAAVSFASCDKDDDKTTELDPKPTVTYAKYVARISDDFLKYGEMTVTFEANNESKTYKMSEVQKSTLDLKPLAGEDRKLAVHELVIPAFEVKSKPVQVTIKYELSEAGKKACAAAAEGDKFDFVMIHTLGECNEKGEFKEGVTDTKKISLDCPLNRMEEFLETIRRGELISKKL